MRLVLDVTQAMYLQIEGKGPEQLHVVTVIDGLRKDDIVDARTGEMDFYNKSGVVVGKLRFRD